jgi:hypothetical protein
LDPDDHLHAAEMRLRTGRYTARAEAVERLSLLPERRLTRWVDWVFAGPQPQERATTGRGEALVGDSGVPPAAATVPAGLVGCGPWRRRRIQRALRASQDYWGRIVAEQWALLAGAHRSWYGESPYMERLNLLRDIPLFAELDLEDLRELEREFSVVRLRAGDVLFHEGDEPDGLYIIVSGELEIVRDRNESVLARLEEGQPVGEMALLDEAPRSATARVTHTAELLRLSSSAFHSLVMQRPQILLAMCRVLARRLRR